jgi:fibronectin type 3 domain-containing protein
MRRADKLAKLILMANISIITLLSLLIGANCGLSYSFEIIQQTGRDTPNSEGLAPEISKELRDETAKTVTGFSGGFLENKGQHDSSIRYFLHSPRMPMGFGRSQLWLSINPTLHGDPGVLERFPGEYLEEGSSSSTIVTVTFPGSNAIEPVAEKPTGACYSFLYGSDQTKWSADNPYYAKLIYRNLYKQIDLVYELRDRQLKYEFIVYPGGCPESIRLHWDGLVALSLQATGIEITVKTATGPIMLTDSSPLSYQADNPASPIPSAFFLEDSRTYGFSIPAYDSTRPLIIDPLLSTFLGGGGDDYGYALAVGKAGDIWVTGETRSLDFSTSADAFDIATNGGPDVFISRFSADGSILLYSTYLGGGLKDVGHALAVDEVGNVWVTGYTSSPNFPTTSDALDPSHNGNDDVFIAQLATNGTLLYSTYLGSGGWETGEDLVLDEAGNVWVTGFTTRDFPTTSNAFDTTKEGDWDAFLLQIAGNGSILHYSTFLGGKSFEVGYSLAMDGAGNIWVTGITSSGDFPITSNAFDPTHNSYYDVFITQFAPNGTLLYSTFLGGTREDFGQSLAVDEAGNVWVTGKTISSNFPVTAYAFDRTHNGDYDAFVACLVPENQRLLFSTYLGGSGYDWASAMALDGAGGVWVTGGTPNANLDFPTTPDALYSVPLGSCDVFITRLGGNGSTLLYSTFLGSGGWEAGGDLMLDEAGSVWVTGSTGSVHFPMPYDAVDPTHNGYSDVFLCALMRPSSPENLSAEINAANAVLLTWDPPLSEGNAPISAYRVYKSTTSALYSSYLVEITNHSLIDWFMFPGQTYYYTVTAVSSIGESHRPTEVNITFSTLPDAPQGLVATPRAQFIALEWEMPTNGGIAPITSYRIYRGTLSGQFILLGVPLTPYFNDTTALAGITYYYVVTAVNELGESHFSNEVATTLLSGPSAPHSLIAIPSMDFVSLQWNASLNDGGSLITFYRVYRGTTSGQYSLLGVTASTAFNDSMAEAGKLYYYVVTAVNALGESSISDEVLVATTSPLGVSDSQNGSAPSWLVVVICLGVAALWFRKRKKVGGCSYC